MSGNLGRPGKIQSHRPIVRCSASEGPLLSRCWATALRTSGVRLHAALLPPSKPSAGQVQDQDNQWCGALPLERLLRVSVSLLNPLLSATPGYNNAQTSWLTDLESVKGLGERVMTRPSTARNPACRIWSVLAQPP